MSNKISEMKQVKFLPIILVTVISFQLTSCGDSGINLENTIIQNYIDAKTAKERYQIELTGAHTDSIQQNIHIDWDSEKSYGEYRVVIADNQNFKNPFVYDVRYSNSLEKGMCIPGKHYFYKVLGKNYNPWIEDKDLLDFSNCDEIKKGEFSTKANTIRFADIDGVYNVRDLGGWRASNKIINYQKLYRGGNFKNMTADGLTQLTRCLNIKTEIDLRDKSDRPDRKDIEDGKSVLGETVQYVESPIIQCSYIFEQFNQVEPVSRSYYKNTKSSLYTAFTTLADESNYPIYFHCNAGADRTGTFAFLIEGLLGVSIDNLCLDYEFTCFSRLGGNQWRGPIDDDIGGRILGTAQDDSGNYCAFGPLIDNMMKWYGKDNGAKDNSLSSAIENYLKRFVGIDQNKIDKIKSILLK